MRLSTAVALSLFLMSPMALAQNSAPAAAPAAPIAPPSPAQLQLAQKLYDDARVDQVFESITGLLVQQEFQAAGQAAGDKGSCPALRPPAQAFVQKMQPMLANLADPAFRTSAATIYANNLSETELRDVTNFLESSSGKKWNAVSAQMNQQIMELARQKAASREAQVKTAVGEFETSFKSALATCPSSAPAAQTPAKKKSH